ncbi:MAG TPA: YibE/F family protein [Peptococcaceae bacterium]|nr:YibE/F family protein [Peptococcaceae bacterium]
MRRALTPVVLTVILLVGVLTAADAAQAGVGEADGSMFRARVLSVEPLAAEETLAPGFSLERQLLTVKVVRGPFAGQTLVMENAHTGHPAYDLQIEAGDLVLVWAEVSGDRLVNAYLIDYARDQHLVYLVAGFVLAMVVIGGWKGFKAVVTVGIIGLAIVGVMLPLLLQGHNPIILAVLVSAGVVAVTFAVIGGLGVKTLAATIGTVGGVVVAGTIAFLVGMGARLTGFGSEETAFLLYIPQDTEFDFRGLLFAGIIIGALGAVMDVGMSVASAMEEVKRANPSVSPLNLWRAGMNVGRDIMGTMANTLILAYTGASIPLLLVFMAYDTPFLKIINLDLMATEVVRALAGSIGLILCVPLTALAAAVLMSGAPRGPVGR